MSATTYRELLRAPSITWMLATSVVGRFHQGMAGLAVMMLTTERSTYAVYSVVSAAAVAGGLVAGPLWSRLADAHGYRRVLVLTSLAHTVTMGALILVPAWPALFVALSLLIGLCTPPMTAAVRVALPALIRNEQRRGFFALEATAQEVIFVAGPVITALLAALGGPRLALGGCAGLVLAGTLAYVCDRNVEAGRVLAERAPSGQVLRERRLLPLFAAAFLLTAALAGQVLGTVAVVSGQHVSSEAGFVLACGSLGSLVGGLIHGMRGHRRAGLRRLLLTLAAGLAVLPLAPGPVALSLLLFLWGMTVAPVMSVLFERLSSQAPAGSAAEAFGWMGSAFAVGNVLGSVLGGVLIPTYGARAPIVAACALAVLAALVCEPWHRSVGGVNKERAQAACREGEKA
ncbi:MFS transporter [Streptomyces sp. NBC_01231]|nr:MFS transporter [Streptomyces sp. NBC_01231]